MSSLTVCIQPIHPEVGKRIPLPQQMSEHASGFDVCAAIDEEMVIQPGDRRLIPCGFAMAIPVGFECQVRPRSGLAIKYGIAVLNTPGTIDADYRGEVRVILINLGLEPFVIEPGDRIAQLVFAPILTTELVVTANLENTARSSGGFGSTGK